ncbi:MAG: hypothetical protein AAFQ10_00125 [Pseudomonadota bacterium]
MVIFEDREDVRDWLKPKNYIEFWEAVAPYNLTLQDRDHCDALIANGTVEQDLVLSGLKGMAVQELSRMLGLKSRIPHIERSMKVH